MKKILVGVLGVVAALTTGCMTGQNSTTLDEIAGATGQSYVEAFIEYKGPAARWAGPPGFVMHVSAKDADESEITVPVKWQQMTTAQHRKPASTLTSEEARAKLTGLASAVNEEGSAVTTCLSPIHVRLIRADGNVLDKKGCRGQSHWAKAASDAVDFFVAMSGD